MSTLVVEQRTCPRCQVEYETEIIELMGSRFPQLSKCESCLDAERTELEAEAELEQLDLARQERAELAARDPEKVLTDIGFSDDELFGKDLRNFECPTALHTQLLEAAKDFARHGLDRGPVMFMFGAAGRGKSHLARGVAKSFLLQGIDVRYYKLQDLIANCKKLFGRLGETADEYVNWLCGFNGLVIIDELGRSAGDNWDTNSVIFRLASKRMSRSTIWISNFNLVELEKHYDEAVVSRIQAGTVVRFARELEDFRVR